MTADTPKFTIGNDEGITIGVKFFNGCWYRWSSTLDAYALCDDESAVLAIVLIVKALGTMPYAVPLSAALNVDGGIPRETLQ